MHPTRLLRGASLALLSLLALAAAGDATTIRPLPFREIARRADRIVVATVAGSSCRLGVGPAGIPRPYTDWDLRDVAVLEGDVRTRNLLLPVVGGTVDGYRTTVHGTPEFEVGRRYVLFLKSGEPLTGLVGWTQGVFRLEPRPDGRDRVFTHDGAPVHSLEGGKVATGGAAMDLVPFLEAIRAARAEGPVVPEGLRDGPRLGRSGPR
ncbi:MAG: hypothetical protein HUU06_09115 [Planctomycetaceae bacterium]|nr:hypothetical protein [Planctomycetaceae bacterium]